MVGCLFRIGRTRLRSCQERSGGSPRHQPRPGCTQPASGTGRSACVAHDWADTAARARPQLGLRRVRAWSSWSSPRPMPMALALRRRPRAALQRRLRGADRRPSTPARSAARPPRCSRRSGPCPASVRRHRALLPARASRSWRRSRTLPLVRAAAPDVEQAVFTRGHSPVRDSAGQIVGVLTVAAETTQVTQQLQSLSEFAAALAGTLTLDDVARVALRYAITTFDADQVSFAVDEGGGGWRMVRRVRGELLDEADERLPPLWRRAPADWSAPVVGRAPGSAPSFIRRRAAAAGHRGGPPRPEDPGAGGPAAAARRWSAAALAVGYQVPHTWSPAERALLAAVGRAGRPGRRAGPPVRDPARHRPTVAAQHAAGAPAGPAPAADRGPLRPGRRRQRGRWRLLRRVPAARRLARRGAGRRRRARRAGRRADGAGPGRAAGAGPGRPARRTRCWPAWTGW